ncbi:MAG: hypothetical protein MUF24_07360 [Chitinophagaceae bacterium]|nr:hypothetical protein [Chitinophagaceae bacterium]
MQHSFKSQVLLKALLVVQIILLLIATIAAVQQQGWNLFPIFIENVKALNWNGQFNLDFSCYLLLSGLWIMWRHRFAPSAVIGGAFAMVAGILAFAPYLLYLLFAEKGNLVKVLLGKNHP